MKMNALETLAMNNPIRALIQRYYEMPLLRRLGGRLDGLKVLEIGCGRGVGTKLLLDEMGAREVIAVDLDERMLAQARRRLSGYGPERLTLQVGDVGQIDFADESFDAVFDFAAVHHVPNWQAAVAEIARVLKPGGRFFFQEVTARWIGRFPYRVLFEHPRENRFSSKELISEIERLDIHIGEQWVERGGGDFVFGVGHKLANANQE